MTNSESTSQANATESIKPPVNKFAVGSMFLFTISLVIKLLPSNLFDSLTSFLAQLVVLTSITLALNIAGVIAGHLSLRNRLRTHGGRGLGLTCLVLNYLAIGFTLADTLSLLLIAQTVKF